MTRAGFARSWTQARLLWSVICPEFSHRRAGARELEQASWPSGMRRILLGLGAYASQPRLGESVMTYVVVESCIKCKYMDCVEVCPVDCFYEGENMLVIHPDECI